MNSSDEETVFSIKAKILRETNRLGPRKSMELYDDPCSPHFPVNNMSSEIFKKKTQSPTITTRDRRITSEQRTSKFKLDNLACESMFEPDDLEQELWSE